MKIETTITEALGVYYVTIGLFGDRSTALTPAETEAIAAVGEPLVETGGDFTGSATFSLPLAPRSFPTQFPVTQKFAVADYGNARTRAIVYHSTLETRINTAMTTMRTAFAAQSGEATYVTTYDTTP